MLAGAMNLHAVDHFHVGRRGCSLCEMIPAFPALRENWAFLRVGCCYISVMPISGCVSAHHQALLHYDSLRIIPVCESLAVIF